MYMTTLNRLETVADNSITYDYLPGVLVEIVLGVGVLRSVTVHHLAVDYRHTIAIIVVVPIVRLAAIFRG